MQERIPCALAVGEHQANDPFGDDTCYFILNTDDDVFVIDNETDYTVVREIK